MGNMYLSESVLLKRNDIEFGVKNALKGIPVKVDVEDSIVSVKFQEELICGVLVEEDAYKLFNASSDWLQKSTYLGDEDENGRWSYYIDSADETISEVQRLVLFEAKRENKHTTSGSHLREQVSKEAFEIAYEHFLEQADKNAASKSISGSKKVPKGFEHLPDHKIDGWDFTTNYGSGYPSNTPYLNWHVVSIYYFPSTGQIIIGIEAKRYKEHTGRNVNEMHPQRMKNFDGKNRIVAVFYQTLKENLNYNELYEKFMNVSEEYVRLNPKSN